MTASNPEPTQSQAALEPPHAERLQNARVLVELDELDEAETEIADVLEQVPEHLEALSLLAKVKHIRGQLSLAVACMAQIEAARAASSPTARPHLESMLRVAQDPSHAGEFIAVGQFRLARKPKAYLALEEVFQLYVSRQPSRARSRARQVATLYRDKDREVYKLAVLAESWISELSGDLAAARETLERLGNERGFEIDLDRLLALVDVYERIGSRERLEAAVKIHEHLGRRAQERQSSLGRLTVLHRRLGHAEQGAAYEAQFLLAYRTSVHRPSFDDLVSVAARRYLPLDLLRRVRIRAVDPAGQRSARARAIVEALRGHFDAARALLDEDDPDDLKYLADLELLQAAGRMSARALALYGRALHADAADLHVTGRMLEVQSEGARETIAELFRDRTILGRSLEALERAVRASPGNPRLLNWLAALFALQPGTEEQQRALADRAAALEAAVRDVSRASGRSLAAAVYHFFGRTHGLIHEVWATRQRASAGAGGALQRDDVLGGVTDEMRDSVRNTFFAVRQYAQAKFPYPTRDILDHQYFYKVTKEDEPSGGVSAGLPTALAFLSVFLQRALPGDVASTGALVADAHDVLSVHGVGDIEHKVHAAYHRNLRLIVVPSMNRSHLEQSALVPRAVLEEIVGYASNLDDAVRLVFGEDAFL